MSTIPQKPYIMKAVVEFKAKSYSEYEIISKELDLLIGPGVNSTAQRIGFDTHKISFFFKTERSASTAFKKLEERKDILNLNLKLENI